LYYDSILLL